MAKRTTPSVAAPADAAPDATWSGKLRSPVVVCLLLVVATFLAYNLVAGHGFVDYDDGDYVSANPHVETGLSWDNTLWAFTTGHASNWHPLTWLSHMVDYQLFGRNPGAQHLVNLGFHIANTILLFLVLRRMTRAHWRSAAVAALFALHPLHVESVAWLSERKDVLSTFFLFLTIGAYAQYARGPQAAAHRPPSPAHRPQTAVQGPRWIAWYLLALACFALGLLSKPMLVTVPFLLLLLDYWPLDRIRLVNLAMPAAGFGLRTLDFRLLSRLVLEKLPFFALSAVSSAVTFIVQRKGGAVSAALSFDQRLGNAFVSYVRYLWKMIWPENLAVLYPHPGNWPLWMVIGSALLLVAIFVLVVWLVPTRPYAPVGWFWFFGGLIPVIGLVQVGIQSMADRYTYVPLVGIFIVAAWGIQDLADHFKWRQEALAFGMGSLLLVLGLLTMRQTEYWRNTETLFQRAVQVEPKNYLAYNNLGFYYANQGKIGEAIEHYRKSIAINPLYEDALNNMGHALAKQQKHAEAIRYYEAALRVKPLHVEVHNNFGNALSELGKIDEAIDHYLIALRQNPDHADAHNNLGIALAVKGKLDEAMPHFRDAIRLKPNYASAHSNLGNALAVQQKWNEAIAEYQQCLKLNPDDPQAHNNLGNVLAQLGRLDEAVQHYEQALRLNANNPEAHFNLGMAFVRLGRRNDARSHFQEALRLRPGYAEAQRQLEALAAAP